MDEESQHYSQDDFSLDTDQVISEDSRRRGKQGRKTKETLQLLIQYYQHYEGTWSDSKFASLIEKTGFSKRQLNKWFWDRKKKETEQMEFKKLSYPGLIFRVECTRTGKDLTPSFRNLCCKPIFKIDRISKQERAAELANSC